MYGRIYERIEDLGNKAFCPTAGSGCMPKFKASDNYALFGKKISSVRTNG